jgi:hypothetical protein
MVNIESRVVTWCHGTAYSNLMLYVLNIDMHPRAHQACKRLGGNAHFARTGLAAASDGRSGTGPRAVPDVRNRAQPGACARRRR